MKWTLELGTIDPQDIVLLGALGVLVVIYVAALVSAHRSLHGIVQDVCRRENRPYNPYWKASPYWAWRFFTNIYSDAQLAGLWQPIRNALLVAALSFGTIIGLITFFGERAS